MPHRPPNRTDLVGRLRAVEVNVPHPDGRPSIFDEAADRIAELEAALRPFAEFHIDDYGEVDGSAEVRFSKDEVAWFRAAANAMRSRVQDE